MAEGEDGGFGGAASVRRSSIAGSKGKAEGGRRMAEGGGEAVLLRRCRFGGPWSIAGRQRAELRKAEGGWEC
nr:hypothetical protein Itr_chr08CG00070 [Ipomoea trifida]